MILVSCDQGDFGAVYIQSHASNESIITHNQERKRKYFIFPC